MTQSNDNENELKFLEGRTVIKVYDEWDEPCLLQLDNGKFVAVSNGSGSSLDVDTDPTLNTPQKLFFGLITQAEYDTWQAGRRAQAEKDEAERDKKTLRRLMNKYPEVTRFG